MLKRKVFRRQSSVVMSSFCRDMGFVVDKVSEDSFYENLLLGLSRVLEKSPCVSKVTLKRIPGVRYKCKIR